MVKGINSMHLKGWAHCDIKLSNMVLDDKYKVHVIDFGFACRTPIDLSIRKGTEGYEAPELFGLRGRKQRIDTSKVDVFALGVTLLAMFFKDLPFYKFQTIDKLNSGDPEKVEKYCRAKYGNESTNFPKSLMNLLA